jgi:hypothetical protein
VNHNNNKQIYVVCFLKVNIIRLLEVNRNHNNVISFLEVNCNNNKHRNVVRFLKVNIICFLEVNRNNNKHINVVCFGK